MTRLSTAWLPGAELLLLPGELRPGAAKIPRPTSKLSDSWPSSNYQLGPESAPYLSRPDLALGGFRRSLTHWEIRVDYVQHNISALLGSEILLEEASSSAKTGSHRE